MTEIHWFQKTALSLAGLCFTTTALFSIELSSAPQPMLESHKYPKKANQSILLPKGKSKERAKSDPNPRLKKNTKLPLLPPERDHIYKPQISKVLSK